MLPSRQLFYAAILSGLLFGCGGGGGGGDGAPPVVAPPTTAPVTPPAVPLGNFVTLHSDAGDPLGQGRSYKYSSTDAKITVTAEKNTLTVGIKGDEEWTGVFQTGGNATELKVGDYLTLDRWVADAPAKGGMTWWNAEYRGCQTSTGRLTIDSVTYSSGHLVSIALRFERYCSGASGGLRGELKYSANDNTVPTPIGAPPGGLWQPPAVVAASAGNFAYFDSAPGDYVGLGRTYWFDQRNSEVKIDGGGNGVKITVKGDDLWSAELRGIEADQRMKPGFYPGVKAARFSNPVKGGLSWTGAGRGCSQSTGWFVIDAIAYDSYNSLTLLDLRFEQHCEGREAPLRGAIRYRQPITGGGSPAAISNPGSWGAPSESIPQSDNFMYFESDENGPLGRSMTDSLTSRNAAFEVEVDGNSVHLHGKGNRNVSVRFRAPSRFAQIVPGIYSGVTTPPGDAATYGALYVARDGYGCDAAKGWVVVDSVSYVAAKLSAIELRFELACAGNDNGLMHGHVRWRSGVPSVFPGPEAVPDLFWRADIAVPEGSYAYISSDRTDFLDGRDVFTPVDSVMQITEKSGRVDIVLRGFTNWSGTFETMTTAGKVLPGYYPGLSGALRPARGLFLWGGDGRGCNVSSSGVVVDKAVYLNERLSELELRFEHHCEDEPGAMRGQLRWLASDTRKPPGPATPTPLSLWRAPAGALPAAGNYLYIESAPGEAIGGGRTHTLSPQNARFSFQSAMNYHNFSGSHFALSADAAAYEASDFRLEFQTMSSIGQMQPGFYNWTMRYPFHNTAFGGLSVLSTAGGCNSSIGWMVLDQVSYANGRLSAVRGRFEQHCDGAPVPLHGEFNWAE